MIINKAGKRQLSVSRCARCGGDHVKLKMKQFARPPQHEGLEWGFWARCPTSGDPILVNVVLNDEAPAR